MDYKDGIPGEREGSNRPGRLERNAPAGLAI